MDKTSALQLGFWKANEDSKFNNRHFLVVAAAVVSVIGSSFMC
jgi:hypothetical protein